MDVSLHWISEDLVIFFKFPSGCQRGVYAKAFKTVMMLNTGTYLMVCIFSLNFFNIYILSDCCC